MPTHMLAAMIDKKISRFILCPFGFAGVSTVVEQPLDHVQRRARPGLVVGVFVVPSAEEDPVPLASEHRIDVLRRGRWIGDEFESLLFGRPLGRRLVLDVGAGETVRLIFDSQPPQHAAPFDVERKRRHRYGRLLLERPHHVVEIGNR